jgi:hypothetical protein
MAGPVNQEAAVKDALNKLLKAHTAKRRRKQDAEDAEEKDHQVFQASAVNAIEKVIGPTLMALSRELEGHGHEAAVSLRVGKDSFPSAHLSFRIGDRDDPNGAASASRLSFSTTASQNKFEVTTEIWGRQGKDAENNTSKLESRPIAEVDAAWVTAQGLLFVSGVLDRS